MIAFLAELFCPGALCLYLPGNKWKLTPDAPELTYKGIVPYKIPP